MGGTNINEPLEFCYNLDQQIHSPKLVYLLTDGSVSDPSSVVSLAKKYSKSIRTFTIGVGNGASPYLVKEVAK